MPSRSTRAAKKPAQESYLAPATGAQKESVVDGQPVVTAYRWGGQEVAADSRDAVAKKSFDPATGITRYWLKRATTGPDRGFLYNPQSPTHAPGRSLYQFRPATEAAFELYVKYIVHPHNPVNLRGAERNN